MVTMTGVNTNKVPPDGGYGWVVVFSYALNNVVVLPLITSFGLVFKEAMGDVGLNHSQGSLVIILNHSIGMLLSFFGGPLLRRFGYRKVAVTGAICICLGLLITAFASSFWMFILSYSIINSMGIALVMAAFTLAINSFFKEKRGRAVGAGMSITGLGAILMPLLMSALITAFGWRYTVLTLSAICLHSLVAACLLRPIKWYLRYPPHLEEMVPLNQDLNVELINGSLVSSTKENGTLSIIAHLDESGEDTTLPVKSASMISLASAASLQARNARTAISHPDVSKKSAEPLSTEVRYKWWESQEIHLGSSINIFKEKDKNKQDIKDKEPSKKEQQKSFFRKFVDFFDLTLLSDPIFVNILFGLSVAACVETNFSLLLPIILGDMMKFETEDIAILMAIIGLSDTLFRFVSPFIGERCKQSPRVMYLVSLLLIIFIRTIMLFTSTFLGMVFVSLAIGVTKGVRTVYMNIVIPSYVPIERLPFASGIQMFFNGIITLSIGSLLGRLRESSGAYHVPIVVLNFVTMLTIVSWVAEFVYIRIKNKNMNKTEVIGSATNRDDGNL